MSKFYRSDHLQYTSEDERLLSVRIVGRRLPAYLMALNALSEDVEWCCEQFNVSQSQVYACLSFYYDNKQQIELEQAQISAMVKELSTPIDDIVNKMKSHIESDRDGKLQD